MIESTTDLVSIIVDEKHAQVTKAGSDEKLCCILSAALVMDENAYNFIKSILGDILEGYDEHHHTNHCSNDEYDLDLKDYSIFKVEENINDDIIIDLYGEYDTFVGIFEQMFQDHKGYQFLFETSYKAATEFRLGI